MAMLVNMHEAKTQLSKLVERAEAGEEIVIARAGEPVVRLVPVSPRHLKPRNPGGWEGKVRIAPDFDELPEELARGFRGEDV